MLGRLESRQVGLPSAIIWDVIMGFVETSGVTEISPDDFTQIAGRKTSASSAGGTDPGDECGWTGRQFSPQEITLG